MAPSASFPCRKPRRWRDDESGFPEQPLGSGAKYHVCLRWQPEGQAGRNPEKIGDPSLIKHVFLIIRENRTYDQILGDVAAGNGDPSLAVFGGKDTPNAHALVQRFPLLDNFYDPSRQSADGHQWIHEGMAPYADDIQSPDWVRSYPGGNAGDALAYQKKGFLFSEAAAAGLAGEDLRRIHGVRYVPTAGRVDPESRAGASFTPTRNASKEGLLAQRLGSQGREDALSSEQDPGRLLYSCRVSPLDQQLPNISIWASPTSSASIFGCRTSTKTSRPGRSPR